MAAALPRFSRCSPVGLASSPYRPPECRSQEGTMDTNDRVKRRRSRRRLAACVLPLALLLAACSGSGSDATSTVRTDATTTTTTAAADDSTALCGIFEQLAAGGAGPNGQN